MSYYELEMGEGIAGPLSSVGAMTTALYSCIGICMVNEGAGRGGLYHYPAKSLDHNLVLSAIIAMLNQVQPTAIYVTPAGDRAAGMMAGMPRSDEEDVDDVVDLLKKSVGHASTPIKVEKLPAGRFASYWRDGRLHLNEPNSTQMAGRAGLEGMEDYVRIGPQALGGGVYYFGINAEKNPAALDPKPRPRNQPGGPPR